MGGNYTRKCHKNNGTWPFLDGTSLQGTIEAITIVSSLLECDVLCDSGDICDTLCYNESTSVCIQVYNQTENACRNNRNGLQIKRCDKNIKFSAHDALLE
jgi:hypothetical protein